MVALSEIEKRRGPRLTPEQKAEQKRQRTQARVGLGSNVLGLTAGAAATGAALRDPRFGEKGAGKTANWIARQGEKIPQPIARATKHFTPKKAAVLAGGALALQAGNVGGDVVANRVLSRSAKAPVAPVKKDESITDAYISKADKTTGHGHNLLDDDVYEHQLKGAREAVRPRIKRQGTAVGGMYGAAIGSFAGVHPKALKSPKRYAATSAAGAVGGGVLGALGGRKLAGRAYDKSENRLRTNPQLRRNAEVAILNRAAKENQAIALSHQLRVNKAYRRYDPEADRQRRLGLYTGAGAGGALVLGSQAARQFTTKVGEHEAVPAKKLKGIAVKAGKGKKALLLGTGAALSGGAGAAAYRRGLSERNNPWN